MKRKPRNPCSLQGITILKLKYMKKKLKTIPHFAEET
jgi:hypothetical protein